MSHHHILIASRQVWPNIMGLMLLRNRSDSPDSIRILHTGDERQSMGPARRLKRYIGKSLMPEAAVRLTPLEASTPGAVREAVASIRASAPDSSRWTVNATGGLKTMFAGLLPQVSEPGTEVFYTAISPGTQAKQFATPSLSREPGRTTRSKNSTSSSTPGAASSSSTSSSPTRKTPRWSTRWPRSPRRGASAASAPSA
jgi:hypothetical protein